MLLDLLLGGPENAIIGLLIVAPVLLMGLTFHEYAHGYAAYKLGDPTAKNMGRLSLSPFKHLDLMGTLSMLLVGIGWAKPVPVNSRYFKNPKWGMALTALAGPLMNLLLSFAGFSFYMLILRFARDSVISFAAGMFFFYFGYMNCYLAIFNLLPIPPFDGSRLAFVFLPDKFYWGVMKYERVIMLVLLVAIMGLSRIGYNPFAMIVELIMNAVIGFYEIILF